MRLSWRRDGMTSQKLCPGLVSCGVRFVGRGSNGTHWMREEAPAWVCRALGSCLLQEVAMRRDMVCEFCGVCVSSEL